MTHGRRSQALIFKRRSRFVSLRLAAVSAVLAAFIGVYFDGNAPTSCQKKPKFVSPNVKKAAAVDSNVLFDCEFFSDVC